MQASKSVAILGTGKMGTAIARRLVETGLDLRLWNRAHERAIDVGVGRVCHSIAETIEGVQVVLTSLSGPDAVHHVLLGDGGAFASATSQVFVDLSTIGPKAAARTADAAVERGLSYLEAPVLGSVPAAEAGKLVILAGGPPPVLAQAADVLTRLGEVRAIGDAADASRLKLIANTELALVNVAAAELLEAGLELGLDANAVWSVLTRLVPYLDSRRKGFLENVYTPVTFTVNAMIKDLKLSLEAYEEIGAEVPMTRLGVELYERAAEGHADDDMSAIAAVWHKKD